MEALKKTATSVGDITDIEKIPETPGSFAQVPDIPVRKSVTTVTDSTVTKEADDEVSNDDVMTDEVNIDQMFAGLSMTTNNLSAENVYSGRKPSQYPIQNDHKPGESSTPTRVLSEEERNSPSGLRDSLAQLHSDEQKGQEWVVLENNVKGGLSCGYGLLLVLLRICEAGMLGMLGK